MFERNDKALMTARLIIIIVIGIFAVLSLAMGIALAVLIHGAMFLLALVGWFFCWLIWVFASLYLSYLCDIKLIRNKLYGESTGGLEVFLKAKEERSDSPVIQEKKQAVNSELEHLQQLLNSGVITPEEYEMRKNELTKEN